VEKHFLPSMLRSLLPPQIRKAILSTHQQWIWPALYRKYINVIESDERPQLPLIEKLIYAWGNQGFSGKSGYIESCIDCASHAQGAIFECGTGLTTLLIAPIARKKNLRIISVEHIPKWADKVTTQLRKFGLTQNELIVSPIIQYDNFSWYDQRLIPPIKISLCICDAPPGDTWGGRKGFLYLFKDHLEPGSKILVDDTIRQAERTMIEEWQDILKFDQEIKGGLDPHAILTIK